MECKIKIGSAYEPKWFEKRFAQGTYSGKNVPLDTDGMWLQNAMIGKSYQRKWTTKVLVTGFFSALGLWFFHVYVGF
jgi:hypothetical protein